MTEIRHEHTPKRGRFYIVNDNKTRAELTYSMAGADKMIIDHTEVSESLAGTGTGKKLVTEAVQFAREKGIKIIPLCPFAASVFKKTPEFANVLNI